MECVYCKEEIKENALKCKHCGSVLISANGSQVITADKSKLVAGVLALLLGGFGAHKFYLGAWGWGIIYVLLIWTWVPALFSFVEAVRYFTLSDEKFKQKVSGLNGPFSFLW